MRPSRGLADGHGPAWGAAVACFADRAAAAFTRGKEAACLTLLDLEPWRTLDAWWLRRSLEPLARAAARPVRYVPCMPPAAPLAGAAASGAAAAWSVLAGPADVCWPQGQRLPIVQTTGDAWTPDGPVIVLAGATAQQLPQNILLSHHGQLQEWLGVAGARQWQALDEAGREAWITESLRGYTAGLPSAMFSLPCGYWSMLEAMAGWHEHGVVVLSRAPGWTSLAQLREHAAEGASVDETRPPVNFHWLAQQLPRIGAAVHTARDDRCETVQLLAWGLPGEEATLAWLGGPLADAARIDRQGQGRAVRTLAANDLSAALSVLELSPRDPTLLRSAWEVLVPAAACAPPAQGARLARWLEQVVMDNPWLGEDAALLRGVGHVALACERLELAHKALRALFDLGRANAADLVAWARVLERQGRPEDALGLCDRALRIARGQGEATALRERIAARLASMSPPWRSPHAPAGSPVVLEPLHADHAPSLARQLRDPSIASMTALPALEPSDDGRAWILARLQDGAHAYAVVHRQLGFVGYVDLRVWESSAFLCYWIGPDFQGRGLCTAAVAAAIELARRNGVELLLSSAYDDNARSLRALARGGFRTMPVRADPPDADRTFVMLPAAPMEEAEALRRLVAFCSNTGSGLKFSTEAMDAPDNTRTAKGEALEND